jgi:hypothetical protein
LVGIGHLPIIKIGHFMPFPFTQLKLKFTPPSVGLGVAFASPGCAPIVLLKCKNYYYARFPFLHLPHYFRLSYSAVFPLFAANVPNPVVDWFAVCIVQFSVAIVPAPRPLLSNRCEHPQLE